MGARIAADRGTAAAEAEVRMHVPSTAVEQLDRRTVRTAAAARVADSTIAAAAADRRHRSAVEVARLPKDALVEIEAIAKS